jgi:large subunit ribosomal protein L20
MRIKRGTVSRRKHNKLFKSTKGYKMTKRRLVKAAKEAFLHAGQYAFAGRRDKKLNYRKLWITRISHACSNENFQYNKFISNLIKKNIILDRKILADMVVNDYNAFKFILEKVR